MVTPDYNLYLKETQTLKTCGGAILKSIMYRFKQNNSNMLNFEQITYIVIADNFKTVLKLNFGA